MKAISNWRDHYKMDDKLNKDMNSECARFLYLVANVGYGEATAWLLQAIKQYRRATLARKELAGRKDKYYREYLIAYQNAKRMAWTHGLLN